jgi:hypothetical protein
MQRTTMKTMKKQTTPTPKPPQHDPKEQPEWYLTKVMSTGGSGGTYQWSANKGSFNDQDIVIVQLPHFSRANSSTQLSECARWLEGVVTLMGVVG